MERREPTDSLRAALRKRREEHNRRSMRRYLYARSSGVPVGLAAGSEERFRRQALLVRRLVFLLFVLLFWAVGCFYAFSHFLPKL